MKVTYNLNDPTRPAPLPRGPWCETDIWLDPDGDWWVRTPIDRMFYVQGPETPVNRPLWGACHSQWEQRLKPGSNYGTPLASFEGHLRSLIFVIEELP